MSKKKFLGLFSMVVVATMALGVPVLAETKSYSSTGHSFNGAWEAADSGSDWTITYGFNTAWINEDYTHTLHNSLHHTATVSNANGAFSDEDRAGHPAGIEVRHSGSTVYYSISY